MNESWARTIIQVVGQEYPASMHHVSSAPDTAVPHELHPAFWGSYDWHSCVHMLCTAAKLQLRIDDLRTATLLSDLLDERLTEENIAAEAEYLRADVRNPLLGRVVREAPELLEGADPDPSQDLFAAGVVAMRMVRPDAERGITPTPEDALEAFGEDSLLGAEVAALGINWRMFGSSGRIEPGNGLLIERFLRCNEPDANINRHIKSVVKPEHVAKVDERRERTERRVWADID